MQTKNPEKPFWECKTLEEMTQEEWELLCDGCARCCLHKLEDEDTGEVFYTAAACRMLDIHTCKCREYDKRKSLVPDCLFLSVEATTRFHWLPETCAYRLISQGKKLADWHPLVSKNPESVHEAGISVRAKAVPESAVDTENLEPYILDMDI